MTIQQYDQQIHQYELEKMKLLEELDSSLTRMQPMCVEFLTDKIKEEINSDIKNKSEITKSLSREQLIEIKNTMNETISDIKMKLPNVLMDKKFHMTIEPNNACMYEFNLLENARSFIVSILENMMLPVCKVMEKYKYFYGKIYIRKLSTDLSSEVKLYAEICVKYLKVIIDLDDITKEKSKQEAEDIWNQI